MTDFGPTPPPGGPQAPGTPPPMPRTPHRGVTILVLGILGIICCPILGIVAWIMGNNDLVEIQAGRMDPAGRDLTNIGRILGMVAVGLAVLGLIYWIVMLAVGGAMMPWMGGGPRFSQ
jgi:ABC-type Fe3+ transport system permease subunit